MSRRILLIVLAIIGAALIALALLPWWWGAALRAIGPSAGLRMGTYERIGYARWAANNLEWEQGAVRVTVGRVEADHPFRLWWRGEGRFLRLEDWTVHIARGEQTTTKSESSGWPKVLDQSRRVRDALERWLPTTDATEGEVSWPDGRVAIGRARWSSGVLDAANVDFRRWTIDATLDWQDASSPPRLSARVNDDWNLLAQAAADGLDGHLRWREEVADYRVQFGSSGWIPAAAQLTGNTWSVPGSWMRLEDAYPEIGVTLAGEWRDGQGVVRLQASGAPAEGTDYPPFQAQAVVAASPDRVEVNALQVQAPGVNVTLESPVAIARAAQWEVQPARLRLQADLNQWPESQAAGRVEGVLEVSRAETGQPLVEGRLDLAEVTWSNLPALDGSLSGRWTPEMIVLSQVELRDAAGSRLTGSVEARWRQKEIQAAQLSGRLQRESVQTWLPASMHWQELTFDARASGPFSDLRHDGKLAIEELVAGGHQPIGMQFDWQGTGRAADVAVNAASARGAMQLAGAVDAAQLEVREWIIRSGETDVFRLLRPVTARWQHGLAVTPLELDGPAAKVQLQLDLGAGQGRLQAERLELAWLEDWLIDPPMARAARGLMVEGRMDGDELIFTTGGEVDLRLPLTTDVRVRFAAKGDGERIELAQLQLGMGDQTVLQFSGELPVTLHPRRARWWEIKPSGRLALSGGVEPLPEFWRAVAQRWDVTVVEPQIRAQVSGTWGNPEGLFTVSAGAVSIPATQTGQRWPNVEDLQIGLRSEGDSLRLERLSAKVEGQPLSAQAELAFSARSWGALREDPIAYLREHARGQVELVDAELAAFSRLAPGYLAPTGRLTLRLGMRPGGELDGSLRLRGGVSRPLGPLGVLQDVAADLAFAGREVELRRVSARMGGQPVNLTGRAALTQRNEPQLDLRLTGENLPLVRQTGVLLRGDLDLAVSTEAAARGRVTGTVRLRDGLFLADLQDVVPRGGGASRPRARPPYFSVTVEPLEQWLLDVSVTGTDFLRLRTPVLESTASARFQLTGTLGEPRAIGEAVLDGGRVRLPFATFGLEEGEVRLTQADPFEPQLSLTGTSRRLGYDLRMELTGPASAPRLQFFSSPPLPSEDILLLVMAGQAPQEEVTYSGTQRAMQIGTFLGRGVIADIFGGGGGDRLSITTGERISRQGRETYRFNYELTPRVSVVGEYDEFDSYNAGLRWRILPGREPEERDEDAADSSDEVAE